MTNEDVLKRIKGGLIVSCQALSTEPLCDPYIMSMMAYAAKEGGAVGIRANTTVDIEAIKKKVDLPIIGIIKKDYEGSDVYITPTEKEVEELVRTGVDIIAVDATKRMRPGNITFEEFFKNIRSKYPNQLFMADTSCFEEGKKALELGYTEYTKGHSLPALDLIERYSKELRARVVAEGGIWVPEQLEAAYKSGAYTAVVGTAITRPRDITRRFVNALKTLDE